MATDHYRTSKPLDPDVLGDVIWQARKASRQSRQDLMDNMDIHVNTLYGVETGRQVPTVVMFVKICDAIGVDPPNILRLALMANDPPADEAA